MPLCAVLFLGVLVTVSGLVFVCRGVSLQGGSHGEYEADKGDDAVPLVRVMPEFPMRAAQRGLEGWVTVEFTISLTSCFVDQL